MWRPISCGLLLVVSQAGMTQNEPAAPAPQYDAELAKSLGADERGLRSYVLVILKTGPSKVPEGPARTAMFQGHFANMQRLANEKKLAFAGPLDGVEGRRGIFIFAVIRFGGRDINREMVAEYHKLFGSAGLMMVNEIHNKIKTK